MTNTQAVDLTIKPVSKYQAADGSIFDNEQEAYDYTINKLSDTPINKIESHSFKVGDIVYYTDEIDLGIGQKYYYETTVLKVLDEIIFKEWEYSYKTKKWHLTTFNKLITWVVNRIPEGDINFELSFTDSSIKNLKKYD